MLVTKQCLSALYSPSRALLCAAGAGTQRAAVSPFPTSSPVGLTVKCSRGRATRGRRRRKRLVPFSRPAVDSSFWLLSTLPAPGSSHSLRSTSTTGWHPFSELSVLGEKGAKLLTPRPRGQHFLLRGSRPSLVQTCRFQEPNLSQRGTAVSWSSPPSHSVGFPFCLFIFNLLC